VSIAALTQLSLEREMALTNRRHPEGHHSGRRQRPHGRARRLVRDHRDLNGPRL